MTRLILTSVAVWTAVSCSASQVSSLSGAATPRGQATPKTGFQPPTTLKQATTARTATASPSPAIGAEQDEEPRVIGRHLPPLYRSLPEPDTDTKPATEQPKVVAAAPNKQPEVAVQPDIVVVPKPERCEKRLYSGPSFAAPHIALSANNEVIASFECEASHHVCNGRIVLENGIAYAWYSNVARINDDLASYEFANFTGGAVKTTLNPNQRQLLANLVNQQPFFSFNNVIGPCFYDASEANIYAANVQQGHRVIVRANIQASPLGALDHALRSLLGNDAESESLLSSLHSKAQETSTGVMVNDLYKYMTGRPACDPKRVQVQAWLDEVLNLSDPSRPHYEENDYDSSCYPAKGMLR